MLTGIDHVIVAVSDPERAAHELEEAFGLAPGGGGRHEAHGTYNRLFWLGDSYVELMGAFDDQLTSSSWWGAHMLSVLSQGSDGQAGLVFATDDLDAELTRLRTMGSTLGERSAGDRRRPDGDVVRWQSARLPAPDPELGLIFLIEHDQSGAEWRPADRAARADYEMPGLGHVRLVRVELPAQDVTRTSLRLLREFGLQFRPSLAGGGARDASIGGQTLRLVPAVRTSTATVVMSASNLLQPAVATLLGVRWELLSLPARAR